MHNFKELKIWQKARILVKVVYDITSRFPEKERIGLTSQLQRAVVSIPTNIAEGSGRNTNKDFARFLDIAISSSFEVETEIILSHDLGYISENELNETVSKIQEIQKMIFGYIKTIVKNSLSPDPGSFVLCLDSWFLYLISHSMIFKINNLLKYGP